MQAAAQPTPQQIYSQLAASQQMSQVLGQAGLSPTGMTPTLQQSMPMQIPGVQTLPTVSTAAMMPGLQQIPQQQPVQMTGNPTVAVSGAPAGWWPYM